MNVPTQIPTSMGHKRRTSSQKLPPTRACQMFVTKDGTTRMAAACAGGISKPSSPMDTVGKPSPMVPLTKPAKRKLPAVAKRSVLESTSDPIPRRNPVRCRHFAQCVSAQLQISFWRSHFVAALYRSVSYFPFAESSLDPGRMPEVFVAKAAQFPDGDRRIVSHSGREIGVFHWQGKFYAYENMCLHQGGPACEGIMMHKV